MQVIDTITPRVSTQKARASSDEKKRRAGVYYDIAFVLLHHDEIDEIGSGATESPAEVVLRRLGPPVELRTTLEDLRANVADDDAQGTTAYVGQHGLNHPETDEATAGTDAQPAVEAVQRGSPRGHRRARPIVPSPASQIVGPHNGPRRVESRVLYNDPTTNDKERQDPSLSP